MLKHFPFLPFFIGAKRGRLKTFTHYGNLSYLLDIAGHLLSANYVSNIDFGSNSTPHWQKGNKLLYAKVTRNPHLCILALGSGESLWLASVTLKPYVTTVDHSTLSLTILHFSSQSSCLGNTRDTPGKHKLIGRTISSEVAPPPPTEHSLRSSHFLF